MWARPPNYWIDTAPPFKQSFRLRFVAMLPTAGKKFYARLSKEIEKERERGRGRERERDGGRGAGGILFHAAYTGIPLSFSTAHPLIFGVMPRVRSSLAEGGRRGRRGGGGGGEEEGGGGGGAALYRQLDLSPSRVNPKDFIRQADIRKIGRAG